MKILLLEDDVILGDIISSHLRSCGYELLHVSDGESAMEAASSQNFDLFIFDINVPKKNGLTVIKELRTYENTTPAIIITAYHDTAHMKSGFDNGCDDYIKKPFELEELELRIQNIKKRFSIESEEQVRIAEGIFLYPHKNKLKVYDKLHQLAHKECEILMYLVARKNRVISSEELMQNIWTFDEMPSDATIRVYIKNLRNLVGKESITTIRGSGYCFE
ncbi:MAG: response regulator transcription factor [Sulfurospirillum sp.]|nr:response regulator transcription factor [Sulfurospirillum sp.]